MEQEAIKGDAYATVKTSGESLYKEKGSKFLGFAFHVYDLDEVQQCLDNLKKTYHDARHFCYAYRINPTKPEVRANDDGEPNNSAGIPIFNQLIAYDLWNTLVVVVRYFGGTKLGVGGLVSAYKEAANLALAEATIEEQFLWYHFEIDYPYNLTAEVMRIIKEYEVEIIEEQMGKTGGYKLAVRISLKTAIFEKLEALYPLNINYEV